MPGPEKQIIRYFSDELTLAEQDALMEQLIHDEALMAMFKDYERVFDKSSQYKHKADAVFAYEKLALQIDDEPRKFYTQKGLSKNRIAAGLLMFFLLAGGTWAFFARKKSVQKGPVSVVHTLFSYKGQKAVIMLADGSKVTLNSGSKLVYPEKFTGSIRMVKLQGEAFFEVAKNRKKPFCILSGRLLTRVLGTSFNIKNFAGSTSVNITVATGHVAVDEFNGKNYQQISNLLPNQQLSYNIQNHSARIYQISSADVSAWKENRLVFNNTPLHEIVASLERLYGVKVIYPEKALAKTAFSARFNSNTSLAVVMRTLASTGQISYNIKGSVLHIKKQQGMKK